MAERSVLSGHGRAQSLHAVMAEGSVVGDRDPRKAYSVYSLVLSRESLLIAVDHSTTCVLISCLYKNKELPGVAARIK